MENEKMLTTTKLPFGENGGGNATSAIGEAEIGKVPFSTTRNDAEIGETSSESLDDSCNADDEHNHDCDEFADVVENEVSSPPRKKVKLRRKCEKCNKRPSFGFPEEGIARRCKGCKDPGMKDLRNPKCSKEGCEKQPSYGMEGDTRPTRCAKCALPGMVDIVNPKCSKEGCDKRPSYGMEGDKKPTRCAQDALPGMVNLVHKTCEVSDCRKIAYYNVRGSKTGRFCYDHRLSDAMVLIGKIMCIVCLVTVATFNFRIEGQEGKVLPIVCGGERCFEEGMEDVVHPKCKGCKKKRRSFGEKGGKPEYCRDCADKYLEKPFYLVSPTCECGTECGTIANFGIPGQKPTSCVQHRHRGMVPHPRKQCEVKGCRELALWGYRITQRLHCDGHAIEGERKFIGEPCQNCGQNDILSAQGVCQTCDPDNFEKARMFKQNEVKAWLDGNGYEGKYVYDRAPDGGVCIKNRPDFRFDCESHMVILEVDEFQHHGGKYTPECDFVREYNLAQALGMPTVFLRYNPDPYKAKNGKTTDPTRRQRMDELLKWLGILTNFRANKPKFFASKVMLFFDGFDKNKAQEECLIAWEN